MGTIDKRIEDLVLKDLDIFKEFKLCYIDKIPQEYHDYTPESKELMETDEYKQYVETRNKYFDEILKEQGYYNYEDILKYNRLHDPDHKFETEFMDYPNPDYITGYTHYIYFTSNLEEQWGDDWDDAPYEYNAEEPYDNKTEVLRLAVNFSDSVYFPGTRFTNSPFSVEDINHGAIPWFWDSENYKYGMGGDTFNKLIPILYDNYKRYISK